MERKAIQLLLTVSLLTGGCAHGLSQADPIQLGSALTKLSPAAEAFARKNPDDTRPDQEFLSLATAHDPMLLEPFKGYTLRVLREGKHAVVLVCDAEGRQALLEDAGCTMPLERPYSETPAPCAFTTKIAEVCR